jgi:hypothetical protein
VTIFLVVTGLRSGGPGRPKCMPHFLFECKTKILDTIGSSVPRSRRCTSDRTLPQPSALPTGRSPACGRRARRRGDRRPASEPGIICPRGHARIVRHVARSVNHAKVAVNPYGTCEMAEWQCSNGRAADALPGKIVCRAGGHERQSSKREERSGHRPQLHDVPQLCDVLMTGGGYGGSRNLDGISNGC